MTAPTWIGADLPTVYRDGQAYFLLGHGGALYLVANRCPHRGGALKYGVVNERDEIVCPLHGEAFAVATLIGLPTTIRLGEPGTAAP